MLKHWCLTFFDKEKYRPHYENLQLYFRLGIKLKKVHRILESSQLQCQLQLQSLYVQLNPQNRIQIEKYEEKDGKASYKLMNNAVYGEAMENLRNTIDVDLVINRKDYLYWT